MLDDILNYTEQIRDRPVWQPAPDPIKTQFASGLPQEGQALSVLHARFMQEIVPYAIGNAHPGFMGWVQGGGTPVGLLADMLAAGLNANVGGREQIPVVVERQILQWMRELFSFPDSANGVFVTGTSIANFIAVLIARTAHLGVAVRRNGIAHNKAVAYTSEGAHSCVSKAMDMAGFGSDALKRIPVNERYQMDLSALAKQIQIDRNAGLQPFLIIGTAGSVDVGAIDNLNALADLAKENHCWFHVDGAFGALGMMSPLIAPLLAGIERADSIAFDFHKWGQVPYDAGYLLVRDGETQLATFSTPASYLQREARGMAAGSPWPCDLGPDLSRGFRALKTWFTIASYGAARLGKMMQHTCELASHLAARIDLEARLELLAPVNLNIVCFRYVGETSMKNLTVEQANRLNNELVIRLQEDGRTTPSSTMLGQQFAIRAAIVNHRTTDDDIDLLVESTLRIGDALFATPDY